jgi:hypothetical protein
MIPNRNDNAGYVGRNRAAFIADIYFPLLALKRRMPMNQIDAAATRDSANSMTDEEFQTDRLGQGFSIDNADRANWLVRRIIEARAYADRVRTWSAREERRAKRDEQRLMYLFGRQLEIWTSQELVANGDKRKSIRLPAGTVGFNRIGPKLVIEDRSAVTDWAREHLPEAIITKEHLSKSVINRMHHDGAVAAGCLTIEAIPVGGGIFSQVDPPFELIEFIPPVGDGLPLLHACAPTGRSQRKYQLVSPEMFTEISTLPTDREHAHSSVIRGHHPRAGDVFWHGSHS